jgi:hypothetical protein
MQQCKGNTTLSKMNSVEKELHGYINGTERMSGFDDYEGNMAYFDDGDYDGFDGDTFDYAGGSPQTTSVSDPYVIQYVNTTTTATTAILFGFNDYFGATNYGNPASIVITNLQGGTYGRLIAQSNNKNFKIGKWRFQSTTSSQLQVTMNINHVDANGKTMSTPLNLSIMRDAYQQQSDIIDVSRVVTIDANSYVSFTLQASATLVISMFPVAILSGKAELNGGAYLNNARAPRLSGKNVAPVIIQTTQDVRGITKG